MAHQDVLVDFFGRYPSALSMPHAGSEYQLICPQCGDMISVGVSADVVQRIDIVCINCGYEDHLVEPHLNGSEAHGVADAA